MSGLHCTIPNGTSAPGKSSAALLVPMNGLTSEAGSLTSAALAAGWRGAASWLWAAPADGSGTASRPAAAALMTMAGPVSRRFQPRTPRGGRALRDAGFG